MKTKTQIKNVKIKYETEVVKNPHSSLSYYLLHRTETAADGRHLYSQTTNPEWLEHRRVQLNRIEILQQTLNQFKEAIAPLAKISFSFHEPRKKVWADARDGGL